MPPPFPDDLHSFAILFDGCGGNLDSVFGALDERSVRGAAQISVADVLGMVAREGETAIRAKLCRACKPVLPSLDPSHPATQPACWSWAIGPAVFDQQRASAAEWPSKGASTLPEQRVAYAILGRWHDGRCAICGQMPAPGGLVRDHDHATGLMRGLLCSFCNKTEGRSNSLLFDNYRRRPPSVILDVEVLYLPPGFRSGIRHTVLMAQ
jgi:hypothetical protein